MSSHVEPFHGIRRNQGRKKTYQVLLLVLHDTGEVENEEFEAVAVVVGEVVNGAAHGEDLFLWVVHLTGRQNVVVHVECDERVGQPAEVLLEGRRDGVNVEVWIGYVVLGVLFESCSHLVHLAGATTLAVDAFDINTWDC